MSYDWKLKRARREYICNSCKRKIEKNQKYYRNTSSLGSAVYCRICYEHDTENYIPSIQILK